MVMAIVRQAVGAGTDPRPSSRINPAFGRGASAPRNAGRQNTEAARSSLAYDAFIRLRHWPHRTPRPAGSSRRRASTGGGPRRVLGVWVSPWLRDPISLSKGLICGLATVGSNDARFFEGAPERGGQLPQLQPEAHLAAGESLL